MSPKAHRMSVEELEARVKAVDESAIDDFVALVRLAGLDPRKDLCFGEFSGCSLDDQDLRGARFIGCDLIDASFKRARITTAEFDWAIVSPTALAEAADFDEFVRIDSARRREKRVHST
jgi:hypothetical protein